MLGLGPAWALPRRLSRGLRGGALPAGRFAYRYGRATVVRGRGRRRPSWIASGRRRSPSLPITRMPPTSGCWSPPASSSASFFVELVGETRAGVAAGRLAGGAQVGVAHPELDRHPGSPPSRRPRDWSSRRSPLSLRCRLVPCWPRSSATAGRSVTARLRQRARTRRLSGPPRPTRPQPPEVRSQLCHVNRRGQ